MKNKGDICVIKALLDADGYDFNEDVYIIEFVKPFIFKLFGKDKLETQYEGWCFSTRTKKERDEKIKNLKKIQKFSSYRGFEINTYKTSKREIEELKNGK